MSVAVGFIQCAPAAATSTSTDLVVGLYWLKFVTGVRSTDVETRLIVLCTAVGRGERCEGMSCRGFY